MIFESIAAVVVIVVVVVVVVIFVVVFIAITIMRSFGIRIMVNNTMIMTNDDDGDFDDMIFFGIFN